MKQLALIFSILICNSLSWAQMGQFYNNGFEDWSTYDVYEYTTQWGCSNYNEWKGVEGVVKSTDAQSGMYAAEIRAAQANLDTISGYVYHGSIGQSGPDGGIPYTSSFDKVQFYYKGNLLPDDTLYLIYIRFSSGIMTEMNVLPAINGITSSWTQGNINIPSGVQDELFIGFIMGNPFGTVKPTPGSWARIDNVQLYNGGSPTVNVPDPGFEQWNAMSVETPDYWVTLNEMLVGSGIVGATKTTDAYAGTYAVALQTNLHAQSGDTIPGMLTLNPIIINSPNPFLPIPYEGTPTNFSGAYKYAGANGDMGSIQIIFQQNGLPIGTHYEPLNDAANYTTFSSVITLSGQPDSIIFLASSGSNPGSVLLLDELSFSGGNVGLSEFMSMEFACYPNPAEHVLNVKVQGTYNLSIVDLNGRELMTGVSVTGVTPIDVTAFESGIYILQLSNSDEMRSIKFTVR